MDTTTVIDLIRKVDCSGLDALLAKYPGLANEEIPLPDNAAKAHPLHRLCDGVSHGIYTDADATQMARIFLAHGARVNGNEMLFKKDTPLVAASSLQADEVALLYIAFGADLNHGGCHGGTALHWAAWCGRDRVVKALIEAKADIHKLCVDFKSTPLLWAVHGYKFGEGSNLYHQVECVRLLLEAGSDKNIPNAEGTLPIEFLEPKDTELRNVLMGVG